MSKDFTAIEKSGILDGISTNIEEKVEKFTKDISERKSKAKQDKPKDVFIEGYGIINHGVKQNVSFINYKKLRNVYALVVSFQEGLEYSLDNEIWQDSNVFENIKEGSLVKVWARFKETPKYDASCVICTEEIFIGKLEGELTEEEYHITEKFDNYTDDKFKDDSITLKVILGIEPENKIVEYKFKDGDWSKSNILKGLREGETAEYQVKLIDTVKLTSKVICQKTVVVPEMLKGKASIDKFKYVYKFGEKLSANVECYNDKDSSLTYTWYRINENKELYVAGREKELNISGAVEKCYVFLCISSSSTPGKVISNQVYTPVLQRKNN